MVTIIVNIIIPTHKARETLPKALDSLVAQTKDMLLVTIVQDGDGEDYSDIVAEYKRRGLKLFLLKKENGGPGEQHYRPVNFFGGEDAFNNLQLNDSEKEKFCKENNIILIKIKYNQYNNLNIDYLKEVVFSGHLYS